MRFLVLLTLLLPFPLMAAEPPSTPPVDPPTCESRDLTFESKEIVCSIRASTSAQRLRLVVNFAGGHDDTIATMAIQLNGGPSTCDGDSKLRLMGEDGDVSLFCRLVMAARKDDVVLRSVVTWRHAQYTGYAIE